MQEEWTKLLLKSERPSLALQAMRDIGVVEALYPELSAMENVSQGIRMASGRRCVGPYTYGR